MELTCERTLGIGRSEFAMSVGCFWMMRGEGRRAICVALRCSAEWGRDGLARVGRFKEESLAGEEKRARVFYPMRVTENRRAGSAPLYSPLTSTRAVWEQMGSSGRFVRELCSSPASTAMGPKNDD